MSSRAGGVWRAAVCWLVAAVAALCPASPAASAETVAELSAELAQCIRIRDLEAAKLRQEAALIEQRQRQCAEIQKRLASAGVEPESLRRAEAADRAAGWRMLDAESALAHRASILTPEGRSPDDYPELQRDAEYRRLEKVYYDSIDEAIRTMQVRLKESRQWEARRDELESENAACRGGLKQQIDVFISRLPVLKSTTSECLALRSRLDAALQQAPPAPTAQPPAAGQRAAGRLRIVMVGNEPKEVGSPVRYAAEVLSDPAAAGPSRYNYEWFLNGVPTLQAAVPTYDFLAPLRGVNTVRVMVARASGSGSAWQAVGEADDQFFVPSDASPPVGESPARPQVTPTSILIRWQPPGSTGSRTIRLTRKSTSVYLYGAMNEDGARGDATSNFNTISAGKRQMEIVITWIDRTSCERNYFRGPIEGKGVKGRWSGSVLSCGSGEFSAEWTDEVNWINR